MTCIKIGQKKKDRERKKKTNHTYIATKLMGKKGNPNSLIIYQPKPAEEFTKAHQQSQNRLIYQV